MKRKFKTVMVINSTDINKVNNHLSSSLNTKETMTYDVGNPNPGLGQAQKICVCVWKGGGVKPVNGIPNPSLLIKINRYHSIWSKSL